MVESGYRIYAALASPDRRVYAEFAVPEVKTQAAKSVLTPSRRCNRGKANKHTPPKERPFRPAGVLPLKGSVGEPQTSWPGSLDGVDVAHWQHLRAGVPIESDATLASMALSKMPPAGCSVGVRRRGRRRAESTPSKESSRCQGRKTFRSNPNRVDTVDQVVFGQKLGTSSKVASNDEFADIYIGHAGKSSRNVADEGEEFLLTNESALYMPSRSGDDTVQTRYGRRKYKEEYTTAVSELLYPQDPKLDRISSVVPDDTSVDSFAISVGFNSGRSSKAKGGKRMFPNSAEALPAEEMAFGLRPRSAPPKLHPKGKRTFPHLRREVSLADLVSGGALAVAGEQMQDTEARLPTPQQVHVDLDVLANTPGVVKALPPPPDMIEPNRMVVSKCLTTPLPTLFVSHGHGAFPLMWDTDHPAKQSFAFLPQNALGNEDSWKVKVVVVVSAHWETDDGIEVTLNKGLQPHHLFYDYCGFPSEMYNLKYSPIGDAEMSKQIVDLLKASGFNARANSNRRLDHGVFVPVLLMPGLEKLPIIQISLPRLSKDWQLNAQSALRIGRALVPLRSMGALIVGSGQSTSTHRIRTDAEDFVAMLKNVCCSTDAKWRSCQLELWRKTLPRAREVHEREEHLLPLHVAIGAAEDAPGFVEAECWSGMLAMTHFRFGGSSLPGNTNLATPIVASGWGDNDEGCFDSDLKSLAIEFEDQEIRRTSIRRTSHPSNGFVPKSARLNAGKTS